MALDEDDILHLQGRLKEAVGMRAASTLMAMFPPDGWEDIARIGHIDAAKNELRHEVAHVRSEIVVEIAGLKVDMANLRAELKEEISGVRTELKEEIASLRTELTDRITGVQTELKDDITSLRTELKHEIASLRVEMHALFRRQTNWIAGFMGTLTVSMIVALLR